MLRVMAFIAGAMLLTTSALKPGDQTVMTVIGTGLIGIYIGCILGLDGRR